MISADARSMLSFLECTTGHHFEQMPLAQRDQWMAAIRDAFGEEGVDISDPAQAQAAFAGAMAVAQTLIPRGQLALVAVQDAVATMRTLADRAEAIA
ncbi:hypothetical protein ORV05_04905 [Amycolatopsis cynarae]|uniref:Uncharacterized protein n=1 Tax=Amycolatopsis cynarae TaxID=2995223 RepID=A0ABY7B4L9_9PSEU|nr:hypothetical protein [Amycolatopsis sp. HUAS 11-8]WAL67131.1 hypothetical protein ORV05_04905 [Amycolatopsis sp. HUAS 11-8]